MTGPRDDSAVGSVAGRVVVVVGTDHHPFDRLINWVNEWLATHADQTGRFFVQWGTASVRPDCQGVQFLGADELATLMDQADVIVCHGGPATVSEAWARGRKPVVVPRLARLGEHVDDHQADFCYRFAALGRMALASTLSDFTRLLAEAEAEPARFSVTDSGSTADQAVACLGKLIEELVSRPRRLSPIGAGRWFRHRKRNRRSWRTNADADPAASAAWPTEAHRKRSGPWPRSR